MVKCKAMETPVKILLDRKREGKELAESEIRELIAAYTKGDVPDYQMAAFAMAVCCRGMTDRETLALTESMRDSGECLDWSDVLRPTADKHSTGGVGDKLSLIIQPLAASCGVAVPSLTGRSLGLTGGTADKLESIPGYNASLSLADFKRVVADCGCSMPCRRGSRSRSCLRGRNRPVLKRPPPISPPPFRSRPSRRPRVSSS